MTSLRVWDGSNGRVAAKEYCDENGNGCIDASALITFGTGSGGGGGSTGVSTGVNYWTAIGNALYNNSGSLVGINTVSPTEALDVSGSIRIRSIAFAVTGDVLVRNASGKVMYTTFDSLMSGE